MQQNKKPDYLILINEDNRLPDGFEDTIEIISVKNAFDEEYKIEKKTYEAYLRLREDLLTNDGIHIELDSVYRSVERQVMIYQSYIDEHGLEYAKKYAAKPGHSEHHTGMAIDVGIVKSGKFYRSIEELLSVDDTFREVHKKLAKHGFILRYPADKKNITKIGYEPWHFRYIDSPEIAKEITDKGICFEEYFELKQSI